MTRQTEQWAQQHGGQWYGGKPDIFGLTCVIDQAVSLGMPYSDRDRIVVETYRAGEAECLIIPGMRLIKVDDATREVAERAADWLNEHAIPQGWALVWEFDGLYLTRYSQRAA